MRLGKIHPIKHQFIFTAVNNKGHKVIDHYTIFRYLPFEGLLPGYAPDLHYLGFKISKKFSNAVGRNKVRRRYRAIYYDYIHSSSCRLNPGYFTIIPRPTSKGVPFNQLLSSFNKSMDKLLRIVAPN